MIRRSHRYRIRGPGNSTRMLLPDNGTDAGLRDRYRCTRTHRSADSDSSRRRRPLPPCRNERPTLHCRDSTEESRNHRSTRQLKPLRKGSAGGGHSMFLQPARDSRDRMLVDAHMTLFRWTPGIHGPEGMPPISDDRRCTSSRNRIRSGIGHRRPATRLDSRGHSADRGRTRPGMPSRTSKRTHIPGRPNRQMAPNMCKKRGNSRPRLRPGGVSSPRNLVAADKQDYPSSGIGLSTRAADDNLIPRYS
jgi:hypothetical protein